MSTLAPRTRKRRRDDSLGWLVAELGTTKRTILRWITHRPELQTVFRAFRKGKQWRFSFPSTEADWKTYVRSIRRAVAPFRRHRKKQLGSSFRQLLRTLGHRSPRAIVRIGLLRHAMFLKWMRKGRNPPLLEWMNESAPCFSAALSALQSSGVECTEIRDVRPLLKAEKLYRASLRWWPDAKDWHHATRRSLVTGFRHQNLLCAALACSNDGKRITGSTLAPLMFRTPRHMDEWYLMVQSESLSAVNTLDGQGVFMPTKAVKRGISLRTFREHYPASMIVKIEKEFCAFSAMAP